MAVGGNGQGIYVSFNVGGTYLATSAMGAANQYRVVGMQPITTTADWTCYLANAGSDLENTLTAYHPIGVTQELMSANATVVTVRISGISKVRCESTVAAGDLLVAYDGISTTTHAGNVVSASLADEANVTCATYGASTAVFYCFLGRALEDGITNSVISAAINITPYDRQFWAYS